MTIFLSIVGVIWFFISAIVFIYDIYIDGLEEDTVFDNLVYYVLYVPVLIVAQIIIDTLTYFRRKLQ